MTRVQQFMVFWLIGLAWMIFMGTLAVPVHVVVSGTKPIAMLLISGLTALFVEVLLDR